MPPLTKRGWGTHRGAVIAVALVAALALLVTEAGAASGSFDDDDGNVHEPMIEAIRAAGITTGCGDPALRRYCPGLDVSRGAMASFLARALDLAVPAEDFFDDDAGSVHEPSINAVAAAGIANGTGPRTFDPQRAVTRGQMATFLASAFGLTPTPDGPFVDVDGVHEQNINAIAEAGITSGCDTSGTRYCPAAPVRRDQMASFLGRALGLAPIDPSTTTTTTSTTSTTTTTTAPAAELDPTLPPRSGSASLTSGFVPDPATATLTIGGPVSVGYLGGGCTGFTSAAPDFAVTYTSGAFPLLRFYAESSVDTTLVIRGPSGSFVCVDDSFGTVHPTIDFAPPGNGRYDVWVPTFLPGLTRTATLVVTESTTNHP